MKCKLFETKEECIDIIREECTKTILFEQKKNEKKKQDGDEIWHTEIIEVISTLKHGKELKMQT